MSSQNKFHCLDERNCCVNEYIFLLSDDVTSVSESMRMSAAAVAGVCFNAGGGWPAYPESGLG